MLRVRARSTIAATLRRSSSTGNPRRASFPPSATINTRTSPSSAQSRRLRPPADVSPDTPAFTISYCNPSWFRRCCRSAGYAASAGSPSPAVRLSPSATMRGRDWGLSGADAGAAAAFTGEAGAASRESLPGPHPPTPTSSAARTLSQLRRETRTHLINGGEYRGRRGARLARRDDREYREYLSDEQRRQGLVPQRGSRVGVEAGCIAGRMPAPFVRWVPSSSIRNGGKLRFERDDSLLEHAPMGRGLGGSQISAGTGERKLSGAPPVGGIAFLSGQRTAFDRRALRFGLLKLDVLALEAASHTVFYRDASRRPPTWIPLLARPARHRPH